jgi:hypothetical protein
MVRRHAKIFPRAMRRVRNRSLSRWHSAFRPGLKVEEEDDLAKEKVKRREIMGDDTYLDMKLKN